MAERTPQSCTCISIAQRCSPPPSTRCSAQHTELTVLGHLVSHSPHCARVSSARAEAEARAPEARAAEARAAASGKLTKRFLIRAVCREHTYIEVGMGSMMINPLCCIISITTGTCITIPSHHDHHHHNHDDNDRNVDRTCFSQQSPYCASGPLTAGWGWGCIPVPLALRVAFVF